MLHIAAWCFIGAVVCALMGFGGFAVADYRGAWKVAWFILLVAFTTTLIIGVFRR